MAEEVTAAALKRELATLGEQLKSLHPDPFAVITEEAFETLLDAVRSGVDAETTPADQLWNFSQLIAAIGCGHTRLDFFNQEDALIRPPERFPVDVRFVGERLYVIDPLVNADLPSSALRALITGRNASVRTWNQELRVHFTWKSA